MTKAPLIVAGAFSAAKIGTVEPFAPIPRPRIRRTTKSCSQFFVKPDAIGVTIRMIAVMKMVPRRPNMRLRGSDNLKNDKSSISAKGCF